MNPNFFFALRLRLLKRDLSINLICLVPCISFGNRGILHDSKNCFLLLSSSFSSSFSCAVFVCLLRCAKWNLFS